MITPLIESLQNDLKEGLPIETFVSAEILQDLLNAALRLADIENAGDEEVDSLKECFYKITPLNTHEARRCGAFDDACDIAKSRGLELAELRERLREAEEKIAQLEEIILSGLAADSESEVDSE